MVNKTWTTAKAMRMREAAHRELHARAVKASKRTGLPVGPAPAPTMARPYFTIMCRAAGSTAIGCQLSWDSNGNEARWKDRKDAQAELPKARRLLAKIGLSDVWIQEVK